MPVCCQCISGFFSDWIRTSQPRPPTVAVQGTDGEDRAMIRSAFVGAAGMVWFASTAAAQPQQPAHSFEELERQVVPGETIYVVDPSDQETKGRLLTLSDVTLTMAVDRTRRQFVAQDVTRIDRRHRDSGTQRGADRRSSGSPRGIRVGEIVGFTAVPARCRRVRPGRRRRDGRRRILGRRERMARGYPRTQARDHLSGSRRGLSAVLD